MERKIKSIIATLLCLGLVTFVLVSTASASVFYDLKMSKEIGLPNSTGACVVSDPETGKIYYIKNEASSGTWDFGITIATEDLEIELNRIFEYPGTQWSNQAVLDKERGVIYIVFYTNWDIINNGSLPPGVWYAGGICAIDSNGEPVTEFGDGGIVQFINEASTTWAFGIALDQYGNIYMSGDTTSAGEYVGYWNSYNHLGQLIHTQKFNIGTGIEEWTYDCVIGPDGTVTVVGTSADINDPAWIINFRDGTKNWDKLIYSEERRPIIFYVEAGRDGYFISYAEITTDWIDRDAFVIKIDLAGNTLWTREMEWNSLPWANTYAASHYDPQTGRIHLAGFYSKSSTLYDFVPLIHSYDEITGDLDGIWTSEPPEEGTALISINYNSLRIPHRIVGIGEIGTKTATNRRALGGIWECDLVASIQALIAAVQSMNLRQGIENSLDAKLENAIKALEKANIGDYSYMIGMLSAFANECEAQREKQLTAEQADLLINKAKAIIAVLQ